MDKVSEPAGDRIAAAVARVEEANHAGPAERVEALEAAHTDLEAELEDSTEEG